MTDGRSACYDAECEAEALVRLYGHPSGETYRCETGHYCYWAEPYSPYVNYLKECLRQKEQPQIDAWRKHSEVLRDKAVQKEQEERSRQVENNRALRRRHNEFIRKYLANIGVNVVHVRYVDTPVHKHVVFCSFCPRHLTVCPVNTLETADEGCLDLLWVYVADGSLLESEKDDGVFFDRAHLPRCKESRCSRNTTRVFVDESGTKCLKHLNSP
jgi:hypothetical protein